MHFQLMTVHTYRELISVGLSDNQTLFFLTFYHKLKFIDSLSK